MIRNSRKNFFSIATFIFAFATLTACGPVSDTVQIKLNTGLGYENNFQNLMHGLSMFTFTNSGTCNQKYLIAGISYNPDSDDQTDPILDTFQVNIRTAYDSTGTYTIDAPWINQYATIQPILLPVPRGQPVEVGVLGSLASSQQFSSDGDGCADFDPAYHPYATTSVMGHKKIQINGEKEIALNVWVTGTNVQPSPTPITGDPACSDSGDSDQHCASQNFYQVNCGGSCSPYQLRFEYGKGRNRTTGVQQFVPATMITSQMNIPKVTPIKVVLMSSANPPVDLDSALITKASFNQVGNNRTAVANLNGGSNPITFLDRARNQPILISPFGINTATNPALNQLTMNWAPATNATLYTLGSSTSSGGPYTQFATSTSTTYTGTSPCSFGVTCYLMVTASNSVGSLAMQATAEKMFVSMGSWGANPTCITGSPTHLQINFSPPVGAVPPYQINLTYVSGTAAANSNQSAPSISYNTTPLTSGAIYSLTIIANSAYGGTQLSTPVGCSGVP